MAPDAWRAPPDPASDSTRSARSSTSSRQLSWRATDARASTGALCGLCQASRARSASPHRRARDLRHRLRVHACERRTRLAPEHDVSWSDAKRAHTSCAGARARQRRPRGVRGQRREAGSARPRWSSAFWSYRGRAPAVLALRGRCYEDESLPYKGLEGVSRSRRPSRELARGVRDALVRGNGRAVPLFPALGRVRPPRRRKHPSQNLGCAPAACLRRVEGAAGHVARQRRLVLFLDDCNGPTPTAQRSFTPAAVGADGARAARSWSAPSQRPWPGPRARTHSARDRAAPQVRLGPLAATPATRSRARCLATRSCPAPRDSLMRESAGSPCCCTPCLGQAPSDDRARSYTQLIQTRWTARAGARELLARRLAGKPGRRPFAARGRRAGLSAAAQVAARPARAAPGADMTRGPGSAPAAP